RRQTRRKQVRCRHGSRRAGRPPATASTPPRRRRAPEGADGGRRAADRRQPRRCGRPGSRRGDAAPPPNPAGPRERRRARRRGDASSGGPGTLRPRPSASGRGGGRVRSRGGDLRVAVGGVARRLLGIFRVTAADFLLQRLAGVEEVVAHRRLATLEDRGDLLRRKPLDLAQQEGEALLLGEAVGELVEDRLHLALLQLGEAALGLHLAQVVAVGLVVALAALARAQVVDREVGDDAVDPGVGAPAGVEARAVLPHAEEGDLDDVAGLLEVAEHAEGHLQQGRGLALHQLVEGALVAGAQPLEQLEVGRGVPTLAFVALAEDQPGHRYRQRSGSSREAYGGASSYV